MRKIALALCASLSFITISCGSPKILPDINAASKNIGDDVVTLDCSAGCWAVYKNGKTIAEVDAGFFGVTNIGTIHIDPGNYVIEVRRCNSLTVLPDRFTNFPFAALPGHSYLYGEEYDDVRGNFICLRDWWIRDNTTGGIVAGNTSAGGCVAAHRGDPDAQLQLGAYYEFGAGGVKTDPVKAFFWYSVAASNGNAIAAEARDGITKILSPAQLADGEQLVAEWLPNSAECKTIAAQ